MKEYSKYLYISSKEKIVSRCSAILILLLLASAQVRPQTTSLNFDLTSYKAQSGLTATTEDGMLTVDWAGDRNNKLRVKFIIDMGVPTIKELAMRRPDGGWTIFANDLTPEFRVVSGIRRVTQQQTEPLQELGVPLTAEKLNEVKWDAFWDAPLYLNDEPPLSHGGSIPAAKSFVNHPGMPRNPDEVDRATASYHATGCKVRTNGARLEITFPGVELGIFFGYLQYDIFKGSNLIRQMVVAKTDEPSVAFKYDAGLKGLPVGQGSRIVWKDLQKNPRQHDFDDSTGSPRDTVGKLEDTTKNTPYIVTGNNRLIAAELQSGAIAAFPPPHSFYWARESEQNLGYGWYKRDGEKTFSFGIRQAELEKDSEFYHNFALYSARPGTWQRMPMFLYVNPESGEDAIESALTFTHGDRFKSLPDHRVMGSHYHVGLVKRLKASENPDPKINDVATMKATGIDIYGVIDGARGPGRKDTGELFLNDLAEYYEAARGQSENGFLVMPNDENSTGGRKPFMGGHYDLILSKPLYWRPDRKEGQPLSENHPDYGTVYNIGTPADLMEMTERENAIISMAHPNAKRSTGYPEAIKNEPHFLHKNYFALGYRWGMGIDASEIRLGQYRFLSLWDEANNWMAARDRPPKFAMAISEARSDIGERGKPLGDDTYGMSPVNYLKIDSVPSVDDMSSIVNAYKAGNYFVTSGEVLIPKYTVQGDGNNRTIIAEVEWTFPLDFVEIVWGDGEKTDRLIIPTTDLPPFGKKRFEIPFDAAGKKWMRFAAWDVATNGALVQPIDLNEPD